MVRLLEKKKGYNKEYYEKNKEKMKETRKKSIEKNKDKIREQQKKYREENREKIREVRKNSNKKWREELRKYPVIKDTLSNLKEDINNLDKKELLEIIKVLQEILI